MIRTVQPIQAKPFVITNSKQNSALFRIYAENDAYQIRFTYAGNYEQDKATHQLDLFSIIGTVKPKQKASIPIDYLFVDCRIDPFAIPEINAITYENIDSLIERMQQVKPHLIEARRLFDQIFPPKDIAHTDRTLPYYKNNGTQSPLDTK